MAAGGKKALGECFKWFDLTVKCPSWWSGKWMKRYSVATSCMMESPRNSILWLWPLDKKNKGTASGVNRGEAWRENTRLPKDNVGNETICGMGGGLKKRGNRERFTWGHSCTHQWGMKGIALSRQIYRAFSLLTETAKSADVHFMGGLWEQLHWQGVWQVGSSLK